MTFSLELLLIGLVMGYYARTIRDLAKSIVKKLGIQIKEMRAKGDSGVIRQGRDLVTVERGGKRFVQPVNTQDETNVFRAPNPREVALQNEVERNNPNL